MSISELHTARLTLRPHTLADFEDIAALWGDAEVTRHIGGRPFSREEVWSRLLRYVGHWSALGYGYWCVRERDGGRFVGELGFADLQRALEPAFEGAPEIGWALSPTAQGRGLAHEAVSAAVAWGDAHFDRARTVCLIAPDNARSIRLAERLGYRRYASTTYKDSPTVLFERLPEAIP